MKIPFLILMRINYLSKYTIMDNYIKPYFKLSEFFIGCTVFERASASIDVLSNLMELSQLMQSIRVYAATAITITSGYRDEYHNNRVGGVSTSEHLAGSACDFRLSEDYGVHRLVPWILAYCQFGQLVHYDTFLHISLSSSKHHNEYIDKRSLECRKYCDELAGIMKMSNP